MKVPAKDEPLLPVGRPQCTWQRALAVAPTSSSDVQVNAVVTLPPEEEREATPTISARSQAPRTWEGMS
jgi:hypothetical protein